MKKIIIISTMIFLFAASALQAAPLADYKDRDDFDRIFDEVARNFGAVESAYYTFTMEYERMPVSLQEMVDTGHLRVIMTNPYTGEPLQQTDSRKPGDISWATDPAEPYITMSVYYVDWNDTTATRWMTKMIWIYTQQEMHKWVFDPATPREEQLVRVYCLQMEDALNTYDQRFGSFPDTYEELRKGDTNVDYINPLTGKVVVNSKDFSAGDFWYRKIDDSHWAIVGWGIEGPVYFMSNDESLEEFPWDGATVTSPLYEPGTTTTAG